MKKYLGLLLVFVALLLGVSAFAEESAIEQLNAHEKNVYDALLIMLNDFYNPAEVRILEMANYEDREEYRNKAVERGEPYILAGPDTVILKLSGTNRLGGTLNHTFLVAVTTWTNPELTNEYAKLSLEFYGTSELTLERIGTRGEYIELDENSINKITPSNMITGSVGRINRALKEHWEMLGF